MPGGGLACRRAHDVEAAEDGRMDRPDCYQDVQKMYAVTADNSTAPNIVEAVP